MKELIISTDTKQNLLSTITPKIYNLMLIDQKKTFIKKLLNSLCKDNNLPELNENNVIFNDLKSANGGFESPCRILLNQELLDYNINTNILSLQNINQLLYCLLLTIFHEFRHYQQYCENKDLNNQMINTLNYPLIDTKLYLFQEDESDAFKNTEKIMKNIAELFDESFLEYINYVSYCYHLQLINDRIELMKNGFFNTHKIITKINPFYKKYHQISDNEENMFWMEFDYNRNHYELEFFPDKNSWQCILSLDKGDSQSNLFFEINENNLEILNIHDTNELDEIVQTNLDNKKALIDMALQVVCLANEDLGLKPIKIIINPMFTYDNRRDLNKFKNTFKKIENIKVSGFLNKTYELIYPIENKIADNIKEYN